MLKNILLTLILLIGLNAYASDNFLNSIIVSGSNNQIVLRTDEISKLKKDIESRDRIVLTLKDVKQSQDINTLYKNGSNVSGLIIQNVGNDLKLYVDAKDISKADIVFETPNSAPITVDNNFNGSRVIWSVISVILLLFIMKSARNISPIKKDVNEIIKEREKALYKKFQKEVDSLSSSNYKLKSYRKHVLNGETLRSYSNRYSLK